ncbi:hypothetical protein DIPPA_05966, partial [Diplonema papillatum]
GEPGTSRGSFGCADRRAAAAACCPTPANSRAYTARSPLTTPHAAPEEQASGADLPPAAPADTAVDCHAPELQSATSLPPGEAARSRPDCYVPEVQSVASLPPGGAAHSRIDYCAPEGQSVMGFPPAGPAHSNFDCYASEGRKGVTGLPLGSAAHSRLDCYAQAAQSNPGCGHAPEGQKSVAGIPPGCPEDCSPASNRQTRYFSPDSSSRSNRAQIPSAESPDRRCSNQPQRDDPTDPPSNRTVPSRRYVQVQSQPAAGPAPTPQATHAPRSSPTSAPAVSGGVHADPSQMPQATQTPHTSASAGIHGGLGQPTADRPQIPQATLALLSPHTSASEQNCRGSFHDDQTRMQRRHAADSTQTPQAALAALDSRTSAPESRGSFYDDQMRSRPAAGPPSDTPPQPTLRALDSSVPEPASSGSLRSRRCRSAVPSAVGEGEPRSAASGRAFGAAKSEKPSYEDSRRCAAAGSGNPPRADGPPEQPNSDVERARATVERSVVNPASRCTSAASEVALGEGGTDAPPLQSARGRCLPVRKGLTGGMSTGTASPSAQSGTPVDDSRGVHPATATDFVRKETSMDEPLGACSGGAATHLPQSLGQRGHGLDQPENTKVYTCSSRISVVRGDPAPGETKPQSSRQQDISPAATASTVASTRKAWGSTVIGTADFEHREFTEAGSIRGELCASACGGGSVWNRAANEDSFADTAAAESNCSGFRAPARGGRHVCNRAVNEDGFADIGGPEHDQPDDCFEAESNCGELRAPACGGRNVWNCAVDEDGFTDTGGPEQHDPDECIEAESNCGEGRAPACGGRRVWNCATNKNGCSDIGGPGPDPDECIEAVSEVVFNEIDGTASGKFVECVEGLASFASHPHVRQGPSTGGQGYGDAARFKASGRGEMGPDDAFGESAWPSCPVSVRGQSHPGSASVSLDPAASNRGAGGTSPGGLKVRSRGAPAGTDLAYPATLMPLGRDPRGEACRTHRFSEQNLRPSCSASESDDPIADVASELGVDTASVASSFNQRPASPSPHGGPAACSASDAPQDLAGPLQNLVDRIIRAGSQARTAAAPGVQEAAAEGSSAAPDDAPAQRTRRSAGERGGSGGRGESQAGRRSGMVASSVGSPPRSGGEKHMAVSGRHSGIASSVGYPPRREDEEHMAVSGRHSGIASSVGSPPRRDDEKHMAVSGWHSGIESSVGYPPWREDEKQMAVSNQHSGIESIVGSPPRGDGEKHMAVSGRHSGVESSVGSPPRRGGEEHMAASPPVVVGQDAPCAKNEGGELCRPSAAPRRTGQTERPPAATASFGAVSADAGEQRGLAPTTPAAAAPCRAEVATRREVPAGEPTSSRIPAPCASSFANVPFEAKQEGPWPASPSVGEADPATKTEPRGGAFSPRTPEPLTAGGSRAQKPEEAPARDEGEQRGLAPTTPAAAAPCRDRAGVPAGEPTISWTPASQRGTGGAQHEAVLDRHAGRVRSFDRRKRDQSVADRGGAPNSGEDIQGTACSAARTLSQKLSAHHRTGFVWDGQPSTATFSKPDELREPSISSQNTAHTEDLRSAVPDGSAECPHFNIGRNQPSPEEAAYKHVPSLARYAAESLGISRFSQQNPGGARLRSPPSDGRRPPCSPPQNSAATMTPPKSSFSPPRFFPGQAARCGGPPDAWRMPDSPSPQSAAASSGGCRPPARSCLSASAGQVLGRAASFARCSDGSSGGASGAVVGSALHSATAAADQLLLEEAGAGAVAGSAATWLGWPSSAFEDTLPWSEPCSPSGVTRVVPPAGRDEATGAQFSQLYCGNRTSKPEQCNIAGNPGGGACGLTSGGAFDLRPGEAAPSDRRTPGEGASKAMHHAAPPRRPVSPVLGVPACEGVFRSHAHAAGSGPPSNLPFESGVEGARQNGSLQGQAHAEATRRGPEHGDRPFNPPMRPETGASAGRRVRDPRAGDAVKPPNVVVEPSLDCLLEMHDPERVMQPRPSMVSSRGDAPESGRSQAEWIDRGCSLAARLTASECRASSQPDETSCFVAGREASAALPLCRTHFVKKSAPAASPAGSGALAGTSLRAEAASEGVRQRTGRPASSPAPLCRAHAGCFPDESPSGASSCREEPPCGGQVGIPRSAASMPLCRTHLVRKRAPAGADAAGAFPETADAGLARSEDAWGDGSDAPPSPASLPLCRTHLVKKRAPAGAEASDFFPGFALSEENAHPSPASLPLCRTHLVKRCAPAESGCFPDNGLEGEHPGNYHPAPHGCRTHLVKRCAPAESPASGCFPDDGLEGEQPGIRHPAPHGTRAVVKSEAPPAEPQRPTTTRQGSVADGGGVAASGAQCPASSPAPACRTQLVRKPAAVVAARRGGGTPREPTSPAAEIEPGTLCGVPAEGILPQRDSSSSPVPTVPGFAEDDPWAIDSASSGGDDPTLAEAESRAGCEPDAAGSPAVALGRLAKPGHAGETRTPPVITRQRPRLGLKPKAAAAQPAPEDTRTTTTPPAAVPSVTDGAGKKQPGGPTDEDLSYTAEIGHQTQRTTTQPVNQGEAGVGYSRTTNRSDEPPTPPRLQPPRGAGFPHAPPAPAGPSVFGPRDPDGVFRSPAAAGGAAAAFGSIWQAGGEDGRFAMPAGSGPVGPYAGDPRAAGPGGSPGAAAPAGPVSRSDRMTNAGPVAGVAEAVAPPVRVSPQPSAAGGRQSAGPVVFSPRCTDRSSEVPTNQRFPGAGDRVVPADTPGGGARTAGEEERASAAASDCPRPETSHPRSPAGSCRRGEESVRRTDERRESTELASAAASDCPRPETRQSRTGYPRNPAGSCRQEEEGAHRTDERRETTEHASAAASDCPRPETRQSRTGYPRNPAGSCHQEEESAHRTEERRETTEHASAAASDCPRPETRQSRTGYPRNPGSCHREEESVRRAEERQPDVERGSCRREEERTRDGSEQGGVAGPPRGKPLRFEDVHDAPEQPASPGRPQSPPKDAPGAGDTNGSEQSRDVSEQGGAAGRHTRHPPRGKPLRFEDVYDAPPGNLGQPASPQSLPKDAPGAGDTHGSEQPRDVPEQGGAAGRHTRHPPRSKPLRFEDVSDAHSAAARGGTADGTASPRSPSAPQLRCRSPPPAPEVREAARTKRILRFEEATTSSRPPARVGKSVPPPPPAAAGAPRAGVLRFEEVSASRSRSPAARRPAARASRAASRVLHFEEASVSPERAEAGGVSASNTHGANETEFVASRWRQTSGVSVFKTQGATETAAVANRRVASGVSVSNTHGANETAAVANWRETSGVSVSKTQGATETAAANGRVASGMSALNPQEEYPRGEVSDDGHCTERVASVREPSSDDERQQPAEQTAQLKARQRGSAMGEALNAAASAGESAAGIRRPSVCYSSRAPAAKEDAREKSAAADFSLREARGEGASHGTMLASRAPSRELHSVPAGSVDNKPRAERLFAGDAPASGLHHGVFAPAETTTRAPSVRSGSSSVSSCLLRGTEASQSQPVAGGTGNRLADDVCAPGAPSTHIVHSNASSCRSWGQRASDDRRSFAGTDRVPAAREQAATREDLRFAAAGAYLADGVSRASSIRSAQSNAPSRTASEHAATREDLQFAASAYVEGSVSRAPSIHSAQSNAPSRTAPEHAAHRGDLRFEASAYLEGSVSRAPSIHSAQSNAPSCTDREQAASREHLLFAASGCLADSASLAPSVQSSQGSNAPSYAAREQAASREHLRFAESGRLADGGASSLAPSVQSSRSNVPSYTAREQAAVGELQFARSANTSREPSARSAQSKDSSRPRSTALRSDCTMAPSEHPTPPHSLGFFGSDASGVSSTTAMRDGSAARSAGTPGACGGESLAGRQPGYRHSAPVQASVIWGMARGAQHGVCSLAAGGGSVSVRASHAQEAQVIREEFDSLEARRVALLHQLKDHGAA